jgi:hypothetical protein
LLDQNGILNMLESSYSESLNELVRNHLGTHGKKTKKLIDLLCNVC